MELVDTHAHLDESAFDVDRPDVIARALQSGLRAIVTIGIDAATSRAAVALAEQYPSVFAVVGIQPNYVGEILPGDWEAIEELSAHPRVVGIGETGLDRYWDHAPFDVQQVYFERHIELAREVGKPFVVHCREAEADVVKLLERLSAGQPLSGVMHSFCGEFDTAAACLELGLSLSFAGMLTYRKSEMLRAVAATVPQDRLLVETDAPYLAPALVRDSKRKGGLGVSRNEPAFVAYTLKCLAEVRGVAAEELALQTTANARKLFGLTADEPPASVWQ